MKTMKTIALWLVLALTVFVYAQSWSSNGWPTTAGWTTLYALDVAKYPKNNLNDKHVLAVNRVLQAPATQLLFSWNARRPSSGTYIFSAQVRAHGSTRWSDWYKIAEWGAGVQRSFEHLATTEPSFCYVRLEMPAGTKAQECRLKVETTGGATLGALARVSIAAVDYDKFDAEAGNGKSFSLPSVRVNKVPTFSQMQLPHRDRERVCSPTSLAMVVSYLLNRTIDPVEFARGVYDDGLHAYGSWPFNVAHAYSMLDGKYYFAVTRLNSFAHLYNFLRHRMPVVVSVRGALRGMPRGRTYADGHLLVVIGWDDIRKRVIVLDPAFDTAQTVMHSYDIDDFLAAWERSFRLAYVVESANS